MPITPRSIGEQILAAMNEPFHVLGTNSRLGASIGIVLNPGLSQFGDAGCAEKRDACPAICKEARRPPL